MEEDEIEEEKVEDKFEEEKGKEKFEVEEEELERDKDEEEIQKEEKQEEEEIENKIEEELTKETQIQIIEKIEEGKSIEITQINENPIETELITEEIEKIEEKANKSCSYSEILERKCENGVMKNEEAGKIFNYLKESILTEDYDGENTILQTENVIFQISTLEDQKNSLNPNVSTIDLGICENILKTQYNISQKDSLIVIKTDIKSSDLSSTYVQYEIYNPNTLESLNMSYCSEVKISVSVPVNLDTDTITLYDKLCESGYNLFDSNDDFYNDICATYTSANGTDMTLEDRKKEMFSTSGNITMCQIGCMFESYNKTTKKAKCNCDVQSESTETNITKINFDKNKIGSSFLSTLTNSNFLVLKCYKLAISLKNIFKNKGRIIMTIILFLFFILFFIYLIKDRKKVDIFIQLIIRNKVNFYKELESKKKENKNKLNIKGSKNNKIQKKKDSLKNKMVQKNKNKKNKGNNKLNKANKQNKTNKTANKVNKYNIKTKKNKNGPPKKMNKNKKYSLNKKNINVINNQDSVLVSSTGNLKNQDINKKKKEK